MLCQLLRRQTRAKVAIPLAHNRHRESANLSGQPVVAGLAAALGKQARGAVLLEAARQAKHLTPLQADQHTGVTDTQATRLNPQQHVKTAELLLAHRQHRHGAPPGTPEPGDVSPLSCRGVSSLYCAYRALSAFRHYVTDLWRRTLRRRSQKGGFTWERMTKLVAHPASLARRALSRQTPEVGAGCLSRASPDLCGGRPVMAVPTAIPRRTRLRHRLRCACLYAPDGGDGSQRHDHRRGVEGEDLFLWRHRAAGVSQPVL